MEPDIDADSDEPFIDPQVLARIKFSQIGERRNWESINVHYSGIPGNISLNINERVLLFKEFKVEPHLTSESRTLLQSSGAFSQSGEDLDCWWLQAGRKVQSSIHLQLEIDILGSAARLRTRLYQSRLDSSSYSRLQDGEVHSMRLAIQGPSDGL